MSAPNPQQPLVVADPSERAAAVSNSRQPLVLPSPIRVAADASNSDETIVVATPELRASRRSSSQQPMTPSSPNSATAAALDDRRATSGSQTTRPTRDGASSDQAIALSSPKREAPSRPNSRQAIDGAGAIPLPPAVQDPQQSNDVLTPRGRSAAAPNPPEQQGQYVRESHDGSALLLWDPVLQTLADGLDDVESTRIAQANRYRILTTTKPDSDGETRGFGLAEDHPAVVALDAQLKTLEFLDASMSKALSKQLRAHPLHPWVKAQKGLGDKTVARLLAAVRDPYWNDLHDRPRTVGELFAFCGVAGPGFRRQRGVRVNWNPDARKRLWIIATTIVKVGGPYRAIYDSGRERYADKTHTAPCVQCGVKGSPAPEGSDWRDGHKHAGAVRLVMREVLRDLWTESRAIYSAKEINS